jgi:putative restriction endonuclease
MRIGERDIMGRQNWTHDELIIAFNLYCKTSFGKIHVRNPEIISLAKLLGRTPAAVSWKLANFARLDPTLRARNITGAAHGSKEDIEIWNKFNNNWEMLSFESEKLIAKLNGEVLEEVVTTNEIELTHTGKERDAMVRVRVNQNFFRATVLAAYNNKCCITKLAVPELLNASHIIPWSIDIVNRVNPRNGLCLNAIHDRAFDRGLLTITTDYQVKISSKIKSFPITESLKTFLLNFDGMKMDLPDKFVPNISFLDYHNKNIFVS